MKYFLQFDQITISSIETANLTIYCFPCMLKFKIAIMRLKSNLKYFSSVVICVDEKADKFEDCFVITKLEKRSQDTIAPEN